VRKKLKAKKDSKEEDSRIIKVKSKEKNIYKDQAFNT